MLRAFKTLLKNTNYTDNDLLQYCDYLGEWIVDEVTKAQLKGVILGVSGGIDSAVLTAIVAKKPQIKTLGVWMGINNVRVDQTCLELLKAKIKIYYEDFNLENVYNNFRKTLKLTNKLAQDNLKVRMRMNTLYALGQQHELLVLGTTNADEMYLGYFTKFGDGASDLMPLVYLTKQQIKRIAYLLDIPSEIINRNPSAGLSVSQTDEKDLGISYETVDNFLNFESIDANDKQKIANYHLKTAHKRALAKKPQWFREIKL